jgi:hypothetical protein
MKRSLGGPGAFFLKYPAAYALSLSGAGAAVGIFATRAVRSRGRRRLGWILLCTLEAAIVVGMVFVRDDARRSAEPT